MQVAGPHAAGLSAGCGAHQILHGVYRLLPARADNFRGLLSWGGGVEEAVCAIGTFEICRVSLAKCHVDIYVTAASRRGGGPLMQWGGISPLIQTPSDIRSA